MRHRPVAGQRSRLAVNLVALIAGAVAAVVLLPTAAPWVGWLRQAVSGPGILAVVVVILATVVVTRHRRT